MAPRPRARFAPLAPSVREVSDDALVAEIARTVADYPL
jgi:hypothetical protein